MCNIIPFLSAEERAKLKEAVELGGDPAKVASKIAGSMAATQPEFDEIMQAVLRIANEEMSLSTAFEELAELCESSSEAPKKDERAGWTCAARLSDSKRQARIGEIHKQMTDEKARQSARRKKRKRFDAW